MSKRKEPRLLMIVKRARTLRLRDRRATGASSPNDYHTRRRIEEGVLDTTQSIAGGVLIDQILEEIGGEG
jgi:hypothetical protein